MSRLQGRTALITGASRGIGKAIAVRFAEEGADLFLCARHADRLRSTAAELEALGVTVAWHPGDVSDPDDVQALVQHAQDALGSIDILVNNAGTYRPAPFVDYSLEDFDRVIKVNLYSVFLVTQAVLPGMMARQRGKVINIASTAGKWGSRNQSAYNASKHAVIGLTRCLGLEMAPYNVQVNAICPWLVETDMLSSALEAHAQILGAPEEAVAQGMLAQVPIQRLIRPEEVAHLAVYLASDESDYVNCQSIALCGGYTMI